MSLHTKVKTQLLEALTNHGNPIIKVVDANFRNRGELYLVHEWVTSDLQHEEALLTLQGLFKMWKRPVHIETLDEGKGRPDAAALIPLPPLVDAVPGGIPHEVDLVPLLTPHDGLAVLAQ